jgi:hypothetical protein
MNTHLNTETRNIRTGLRQTEGALDEALLEATGLMQAMLRARQNPEVTPQAGQRSLVRLVRAMQRQVEAAIDNFRVHDEMSELGIAYGVLDRDNSTPTSGLQTSETTTAMIDEAV